MKDPTRIIADGVRVGMVVLARFLNKLTRGKLLPVHVTIVSFLGHIPAAWALWTCRPILAAVLITVFGLMDSLDGALARVQNRESKLGMLFDAVTDRMKEIIVYGALAAYTTQHVQDVEPWIIVGVAGTSLLVSYVKAKGEMALSDDRDTQKLNRTFDGGLARYEVRMTLVVIGLLTDTLASLLMFIIAINLLTAAMRFTAVAQTIAAQNTPPKKRTKRKDR